METDELTNFIKGNKKSNRFWYIYLPYWPIFLAALLFGLATAGLYLKYLPSMYESSASIIIKDNKRGIGDAKMIGELDQLAASTIVENEIEVFKSRALMIEVVNNLSLYAPIYEKGRFRPISAYAQSPVKILVQRPDLITEVKDIHFNFDRPRNAITINSKHYPLNVWVQTEYGILRFVSNGLSNLGDSSLYFSLLNPKRVALDLLDRLDVSSNKISSVISLRIEDEVPLRSEDVLNELIQAYNRASIYDKNLLAANTIAFVDERLRYVINDLDSIEHLLQQYSTNKSAIDIGTQGKIFLESVNLNDQKLSDISMKLAVLNKVEQNISSDNNQTGLVPSTLGIDDPILTSLLNKLYDVELQYEKLKRTTGENNSGLISLSDQIKKLKPSILDNIRSQQQSLETSKLNLYSTNSGYSSMLRSLPLKQRNLVEINRQQNIKSSIYNYLLQKREETALSHSVITDSRLIDKAQSSLQPVGPNKKLIYIFFMGLAILTVIIIISVLQLFNRKVFFRYEIEEMTSFPVIAEINVSLGMPDLMVRNSKSALIFEQFRKLRSSLDFIGIGSQRKKVLITSTISGEGKTFIAINLSLSLAVANKKVVIVEFDLSNPTLATKMNSRIEKGLTEYLSGKADIKEIIHKTQVNENLYLIQAGSPSANPLDFILSQRIEELFKNLETMFDYIFVDTAPVGLLSDGYVLTKLCDATLYIVRHKYTPKAMLERLDQNDKINKLNNPAIIFNGVSPRGFAKAYGYGFGYGYGNIGDGILKTKKIISLR